MSDEVKVSSSTLGFLRSIALSGEPLREGHCVDCDRVLAELAGSDNTQETPTNE